MSQSIYKSYEIEQLEELFSQFLVDSWSHSKITAFSRNEKAFEMNYIFGLYSKKSASSVAGQAYHSALQYYFTQKKEGKKIDLVECEQAAFQYISEVHGNSWKLQKTTPTVEECQIKASKTASDLLKNFFGELSTYEDRIKEVLEVEIKFSEFLTVNGVDIPLPCHGIIDLVVRTHDDTIVIIDHKSKATFSDDEEIALSIGEQAMTYVLGYESKTGQHVDEVWFVENKYSKNKDGRPQLNLFSVETTPDNRRLYEALLYEPLSRMVAAVNNPDYVYLINPSDNFVDKAELYDFWCRTMIAEVDDFNVDETKKAMVSRRLKKIRDSSIASVSPAIIKTFRENASQFIQYDLSNKNMTNEEKIEHVLRSFGIIVQVAHKFEGYSSNTFLLSVSAGVKVSSVFSRRLDIANALDVSNVRISPEMVVYEGKSYLSVDFSKKREKDLFFDPLLLKGQRIPIGKDNFGEIIVWDWNNHSTPHMLVCGATGSGKSVSIQSTIEYGRLVDADNIVIMDPKHEFTYYKGQRGIKVFNEIEDIEDEMAKLVEFMNELEKKGKQTRTLIVFDEFADAVAQSRSAKELRAFGAKSLEENLRILLQKGRSSGFRILAATQRASTKVITGDAKVNFPVMVCFRVPKEIDSKVVLDEPGAEGLAGRGDGLMKSPEYIQTVRFQAFYKDNGQAVVKHSHISDAIIVD